MAKSRWGVYCRGRRHGVGIEEGVRCVCVLPKSVDVEVMERAISRRQ